MAEANRTVAHFHYTHDFVFFFTRTKRALRELTMFGILIDFKGDHMMLRSVKT
jgi:hypothetical protein